MIRRVEAAGNISFKAGVRTQMAEAFKVSKAAYVQLVEQVSIDFGIVNFATQTIPLYGKDAMATSVMARDW